MRTCPRCGNEYPDDVGFCPEDGARLTSDEAPPSLVGVCLEGRYHLEEQIGAGGLGQVYRGRHLRMDKAFAVKLLLPALAAHDAIRRRFDREAQALSRLTHPCCVAVTDYGISEKHGPYIVMELVDGVPLSHHTRGEGLPLQEGIELITMVLHGLEHAHNQGIAHRDLKPDNIMLVERPLEPGRLMPKILDFGLAKIRAGFGTGEGAELTQAGLLVGTPAYMAPERLAVGKAASGDDTLADIYSVGVILYELCCGRRPFVDDDLVAVVNMQIHQPPPPPSSLRPALPTELEAIVLRAMDKQPSGRFATAAAFREALEALPPLPGAVANERPPRPGRRFTGALTKVERPQAAAVSPPPSTQPAAARPRRPFFLAGAALVAAGLVVGGLLLLPGGDSAHIPRPAARDRAPSAKRPPKPARPSPGEKKGGPASAPARPSRETPETGPVVSPALRRATRLWHRPGQRQRGAKQLMRYLAHHRTDAAAHLYVGRLYLYGLWADDGLKLVQKALRIDPNLALDDASLVALTFAYRGATLWRARNLIVHHAGPRTAVVLLAAAPAMRDLEIKRRLIRDARARGAARDPLARRLLDLAVARACAKRRAALAALAGVDQPILRITLALLGGDRCLSREARRMLKQRSGRAEAPTGF